MTSLWSSPALPVSILYLITHTFFLPFVSAGGPGNTPQSQQTCRPYTGKFCRGYFDSALVLPPATPGLATPADKALNDLDNLLEAHMADLTRADLFSERYGHDTCMKPARRIICHLAFPTCRVPEPGAGDTGGDTSSAQNVTVDVQGTPLPICRESCQAVTEMFCLRQLAQIKRLKAEGALTGSLGMLGLPDCSTLPSKWDQGPTCVDSDHHDFAPDKVTDSCYVERGRWYNGTVSVTRSGHTCQSWDQVSPHAHNRSGLIYPEVQDGANFCRNPGGEEPSPWCYTTNPTIRFELCDIKPCGAETGGEIGKSDEDDEQNLHMLIIVIGVPCVVLLVISTAVLLCLCCRRRRYSSAPGEDVDVDVEGLTVNSSYYAPTRLNPKLEALEFPRNDLVFVERIGQGAFGLVFKARVVCSNGNSRLGRGVGGGMFGNKLSSSKQSLGFGDNRYKRNPFSSKGELQHIEFHDPLGKISCDSKLLNNEHFSSEHQIQGKLCQDTGGDKGEGQIVAVKMLKDDASETIQTDFEREASLMVEFEHENIVRLLGVCTIGRPLCLLFEYMSHGDLNDYLQLCSPDRCLMRPLPHPANTESPLPTSLTPRGDSSHFLSTADHLHIARQVCSGMVYLSERGYVHRDLATRNCLVGAQLSVKISDFGLARSVHSMDYYRGSDRDAVPVRWMPPEAILYNKFSTQSDVWSFGVLLWEVFSYAFQPYYGLTHEEVIAALRAGKTLDPPEAAPPAVYSLMKSCWRTKPSARPSFSSLLKCLVSMHDEACRTKVGTENVRL
ncbi:hypothetical protein EGW08_021860 [Elysia chlorotica]|uniref:receptor protein-tyrosine kinase n=1 Tax=Elysia chlorotica TaxID=188477 RepID=A0A3S1H1K9_ELYCH|nr:hypothetical protein EGW08_021860 [Elysia chlorotica]